MSEPVKVRFPCLLESVGSIYKMQIKNEQQLILFNYKVQGEKERENLETSGCHNIQHLLDFQSIGSSETF